MQKEIYTQQLKNPVLAEPLRVREHHYRCRDFDAFTVSSGQTRYIELLTPFLLVPPTEGLSIKVSEEIIFVSQTTLFGANTPIEVVDEDVQKTCLIYPISIRDGVSIFLNLAETETMGRSRDHTYWVVRDDLDVNTAGNLLLASSLVNDSNHPLTTRLARDYFRFLGENIVDFEGVRPEQLLLTHACVPAAIRFIFNNINSDIGIPEIVHASGYQSATVFNFFSKHLGLSPGQFLRRERVLRAQEILLLDDCLISEAGYQVGYTCFSRFCRDFGGFTGVSPGQWLRKERAVSG